MKLIKFCSKYLLIEIVIIFSFILPINNYLGNVDKSINSNGVGYFDYLPSIFIHNDF